MHVKVLQDWCVAKEGVVDRLRKHNTNLKDEQEKYKDAFHTLNMEVNELREKLEEEGRQKVKMQEAKASVEKELMTCLG